jgi:hypothetical protein
MKTLLAIAAIVAAVMALWHYADVIMYYGVADAECVKFANESNAQIAPFPDPNDKKIFAVDKWINHRTGRVVVQLGQHVFTPKGGQTHGFQTRLCVVGGGAVMMPGSFDQWHYERD